MDTVTRVAVVDSDGDARLLVRLALARDPSFTLVGEAASAASALSLLCTTEVDVVLLDRTLADADAIAQLPMLRAVAGDALLVLHTAQSELLARHHVTPDGGVDAYLDKMSMARFLPAFREVLADCHVEA